MGRCLARLRAELPGLPGYDTIRVSAPPKKHITLNNKKGKELIDSMGSPYLNSGETIVLTSNRVSLDAVPYDVMLTSERIFLIDNRNARFEPRIIPLSIILSVQGGKTPVLDPVITILFRSGEGGDARQPLNLVFSQDPGENRKNERDTWVRSLIQLSIARQQKEEAAAAPAIPQVTNESGLRPITRHWVAPEKVRPLSNVVNRPSAPAPVTVLPDEVEDSGEIPAHKAAVTPVTEDHLPPEPVPEVPATGLSSMGETPPYTPVSPARVIIPQIIEELLPSRNRAAPPVEQEPVPVADSDHEALTGSIQTAVRSLTVTEERAPEPLQIPDAVPVPPEPVPAVEAAREQAAAVPVPAVVKTPEETEIIKALDTGAGESVTPEPPAAFQPAEAPIHEMPQDSPDSSKELHDASTISDNAIQESVDQAAPVPVAPPAPTAVETSPLRHPIPPAREIRPLKTTLAYIGVLLLFIALITAGVVLLLPQGPGHSGIPVPQTPGPVQVTTLPMETMQPTSPLPDSFPPATRITTPVTPLPASTVPQEGVWVRVNSTAYYFGNAGNPEYMQQVSGTGDHFYKVLKNDRPVQVSVQKQDNSGALLAVAIFRDGTLIVSRSVTSPMGSVDLLIDPLTARAPGLTENDTLPEHAATPAGLENY